MKSVEQTMNELQQVSKTWHLDEICLDLSDEEHDLADLATTPPEFVLENELTIVAESKVAAVDRLNSPIERYLGETSSDCDNENIGAFLLIRSMVIKWRILIQLIAYILFLTLLIVFINAHPQNKLDVDVKRNETFR
jgi:hypothetical protein